MAAAKAATMKRPVVRTEADIRSERLGAAWGVLGAAVAALFVGLGWLLRKTWRRLLPIYWSLTTFVVTLVCVRMGFTWRTIAVIAAVVALSAGGWKVNTEWYPAERVTQRRREVRLYRLVVVSAYGLWAVGVAMFGFGTLAVNVLAWVITLPVGWPWWHNLRYHVVDRKPAVDSTVLAKWQQHWRDQVIANGVAKLTMLVGINFPRPGVTEATLRLLPGAKIVDITRVGPLVETCLDLPEGSIGFRRTGRAAKLKIVIVENSYIDDAIEYPGPTCKDGACVITLYADGTPALWTFRRPKFGSLNGLVVGSTGSGKSKALALLVDNLLAAGIPVIIGDPQFGQSLPEYNGVVGEYHDSPEACYKAFQRFHAEVMEASRLLAKAGVSVYDENDPRVHALNLRPSAFVCDEIQLILNPNTPEGRQATEWAEEIAATDRKTGYILIAATQLPQMKSLGNSYRLRDALVAGNALILRISNKGSKTTILPDDFVGDPFAIEQTINGKTTAGIGYMRSTEVVGMQCRVPNIDVATAAKRAPRVPVTWLVDQPSGESPTAAGAIKVPINEVGGTVARLRAAFGVAAVPAYRPRPERVTTKEWVLTCLRQTPHSAQALLNRPDCPVKEPQLYAVLTELTSDGKIRRPEQRGGMWSVRS